MPHCFNYGLGFLLYGCMLHFAALKGSCEEGNRFYILVKSGCYSYLGCISFNLKRNGLINSGDNGVFSRLLKAFECFNSCSGQGKCLAGGKWLDPVQAVVSIENNMRIIQDTCSWTVSRVE